MISSTSFDDGALKASDVVRYTVVPPNKSVQTKGKIEIVKPFSKDIEMESWIDRGIPRRMTESR
jgi:hypothetical protein